MSAKTHDSLGRVRRRSQGGAGPKHLPSKDAIKTGKFDPASPDDLGEYGTAWWRWAVAQLTAMGVADNADRAILRLTAQAYQDFESARASLTGPGGPEYTDKWGAVRNRPALTRMEKAATRYRSGLSDCGLTPSARAKFGEVKKEDDPMGDLMRQAKRN